MERDGVARILQVRADERQDVHRIEPVAVPRNADEVVAREDLELRSSLRSAAELRIEKRETARHAGMTVSLT